MRKSKFTEPQHLAIVAKHDADQRVEGICRLHQISPATFYKWKKAAERDQDDEKRRIINVVNECSRKALWTEVHTSISATKLIEVLDKIIEWRGKPRYIRCDNGPEFISHRLQAWADKHKVELKFIQPGKPSQNGIVERLNGTLRRECLNLEWFESIDKLNEQTQDWWKAYNSIIPHSSIGYKTLDEYEKCKQNFYFSMVAA